MPQFVFSMIKRGGRILDYSFSNKIFLFSRMTVLVFFLTGAWGLILFRKRVVQFMRAYFSEAENPVNLAIFRVVLFIIIFLNVGRNTAQLFGSLPRELIVVPFVLGGGELLNRIPHNPDVIAWSCIG